MSKYEGPVDVVTLVDDDGNETLYEILMTIDGQEKFGKNYVLLYPAGISDDEDDVELLAYSFLENEDGTQGRLMAIDENAYDEWDMIEEMFQAFMDEEQD
ncbi:MAG: DUF1292 domain-containing protein [Streptococcaceae bacterium]|jgi:uncharacterized protein YrzB (UPF0473 family)|nr:DUF1292 domain-containing protein [Streptococcaceae bacterium]